MSIDQESAAMFQADGEPTVTWTRMRRLQVSKKRQFLCPGVIVAFAFLVAFLVLGLVLLLNDQTANRRETVREMTRDAWQAYVKHAWGDSTLQERFNEAFIKVDIVNRNSGLTIVESLSTLWLMDLREEFSQGRNWVKRSFFSPFDLTTQQFEVSLLVQRYLGSLLSSYALTDDSLFFEMAKKLSGYLEVAFHYESPLRFLEFDQRGAHPIFNHYSSLAETGGLALELRYISHLIESDQNLESSRPFWREALGGIRETVASSFKSVPLMSIQKVDSAEYLSLQHERTSILYSYLVKSFLQSNGSDIEALDLFLDSLKAAQKGQLLARSTTGQLYIRDQKVNDSFTETMEFPGCNWGAIFGLASVAVKEAAISKPDDKYTSQSGRLLQMGKDIVKTCQLAASMREEGLTPKEMNFPIEEGGDLTVDTDSDILLSPELAESLFVLWRVTGDEVYRETAWQMVTAIRDRTRDTEEGGFRNVEPTRRQDPSLIGGTFKYLYLIFSDDETLLPLDKWVFNAVGQPLPIFSLKEDHSLQ